jgi:hypothetical protein
VAITESLLQELEHKRSGICSDCGSKTTATLECGGL